jgi:hypothetical protein
MLQWGRPPGLRRAASPPINVNLAAAESRKLKADS